MEAQSSLKIMIESRTYIVNNFRALSFVELREHIATFLEDDQPNFELKIPYLKNWLTISDQGLYENFISNAVSPLIYVEYPNTPSVIRVQTYNLAIFGMHANWEKRVHMIAQQIKKCSSDVIGIQEARKDPYYVKTSLDSVVSRILDIFHKDRHTSRDMMKDLMDLLPEYPYHYEHESMYYKDGIVESIALISRFPIANVKTIKLTKSPGDANQRSCLKATINHPKRQLSIFNTHMTYDSKGQILQSNEILGFMDQENDGSPQILTGDMNIKQSYEIPGHLFEGKYKYRGKTGDLKDAFKAANGDIEFPTHPSWKPKDRLDRIYFRNLDAPPVCEVCGYADSKTVWPSDHCSVFADFIIALS